MKIELRLNGSYHIEMHPENSADLFFVREILERVDKGAQPKIKSVTEVSSYYIDLSVER